MHIFFKMVDNEAGGESRVRKICVHAGNGMTPGQKEYWRFLKHIKGKSWEKDWNGTPTK